jgi:hypothetical protein
MKPYFIARVPRRSPALFLKCPSPTASARVRDAAGLLLIRLHVALTGKRLTLVLLKLALPPMKHIRPKIKIPSHLRETMPSFDDQTNCV